MISLGNKVRSLRKEAALSLDQLSKLSGISKSYIFNLERNPHASPTLSVLKKLSAALCVSICHFIDGSHLVPFSSQEERLFKKFNKLTDANKERAIKIIDILLD